MIQLPSIQAPWYQNSCVKLLFQRNKTKIELFTPSYVYFLLIRGKIGLLTLHMFAADFS